MKRVFLVTGYAPAHSKEANELIRAFDLGIEGAFVEQSLTLTATVEDSATADRLSRQPESIKQAFEQLGWHDVSVAAEAGR